MKILVSKISANSLNNARSTLSGIVELAESIEVFGLLQPVIVEAHELTEGRYNLVAGFRRFAAVVHLGATEIEAVIVPSGSNHTINLIENICREDIITYDFAVGIERMSTLDKMSGPAISKALRTHRADQKGTSVPNINNLLRLIRKLDPAIIAAWKAGHPAATNENLLVIVGAKDQVKAWNLMLGHSAEPSEDSEGSDSADEDKEEREPKRKRKSAAQMALMLERLAGTKGVKKADLDVVRNAFDWVMSECETLCGISLQSE